MTSLSQKIVASLTQKVEVATPLKNFAVAFFEELKEPAIVFQEAILIASDHSFHLLSFLWPLQLDYWYFKAPSENTRGGVDRTNYRD